MVSITVGGAINGDSLWWVVVIMVMAIDVTGGWCRCLQVVGHHHSQVVVKVVITFIGGEGSDMVVIMFKVEGSVGVVTNIRRHLSKRSSLLLVKAVG